ncbi:class I SAM-dependent methyltransferase [Nocardia pseudobrasiliensis]|uniref:class I SAM-dependent methyltransferase n=1 Tax=Nocardia pseudobrasiliensis TaxID=45979 RepID=UPI001FEB465A|nr:class I SAM-dependent methyltransferase [Nocardia pseudobrasiliensis]
MKIAGPQGFSRPVLGDDAAAVDRIDYDWARMHRAMRPGTNQWVVALRAAQLDAWCAEFLGRHPDAVVLHLGCGMDTRAFRLRPPREVRWFDVDQPGVVALRRKLYSDGDGYRMIGSSVTDAGWLEQTPTDRPALIVAEGLLMYLRESEVRALLRRLTDRFPQGEMLFDTLSPMGPRLSKLFTKGIVTWGIRDGHDLERWNPRLRLLDRRSALAGYEKIPATAQRLMYRLVCATPLRDYDVLNRFVF